MYYVETGRCIRSCDAIVRLARGTLVPVWVGSTTPGSNQGEERVRAEIEALLGAGRWATIFGCLWFAPEARSMKKLPTPDAQGCRVIKTN